MKQTNQVNSEENYEVTHKTYTLKGMEISVVYSSLTLPLHLTPFQCVYINIMFLTIFLE